MKTNEDVLQVRQVTFEMFIAASNKCYKVASLRSNPSPLTISIDQQGVTINTYSEPQQVDTEIARNDEKTHSDLQGLQVDDGVGEGRAEMQQ